jgi:GNAT superfamily N-acetyltransferase
MNKLIIKHNELTAEEFILLWEAVHWGPGPSLEQTRLAMEHTLFRVSVFDEDQIVAMARVIGDMGLDYYIKDVVVRPEYQKKGIGRLLINEILQFINDHGVEGTEIFVSAIKNTTYIKRYENINSSEKAGADAEIYLIARLIAHIKRTPSVITEVWYFSSWVAFLSSCKITRKRSPVTGIT